VVTRPGMANVLSEENRQQVIALGRLKWSLRKIERQTGVRRETASRYLKAAGVPVAGVGRRSLNANESRAIGETEGAKAAISAGVSTDPGSKAAISEGVSSDSAEGASLCEPYREHIEQRVLRGRQAMAIWGDLVDKHGFEHQYASVRRFVSRLKAKVPTAERAVIETAPGEEAQVDYGEGPMVRDATGKYRRTRLFVMTLGYSRKAVRLLTFRSSSKTWAQLHEEAFRRLGGTAKTLVLDNLKEGVLKPDIYDPELNPLFADVLKHYGVTPLPCRPADPDRKGKVERDVDFSQNFFKGKKYESLERAQDSSDQWSSRWADTRIHGTTKRQVSAVWQEEKPHLGQLPPEPFRYYQFGTRVVRAYGHVEVSGAYYMVPPGLLAQSVPVQWDDKRVRVMDPRTGQLLREYTCSEKGRFNTPPELRTCKTPASTLTLLSKASKAGEHIGALCADMVQARGKEADGHVRGMLALARKHGNNPVEQASQLALEAGAPTYRFVRRYLDRHPPAPPEKLMQADTIIRQLREYSELINDMTQTTNEESL